MSDVPLGRIINSIQERDAVHIAIAPVIAGQDLEPGQHIGFLDYNKREVGIVKPYQNIGIVDPYLTQVVLKGQEFWVCLYPNSVVGMKHHWSHPSFIETNTHRVQAEHWLRNLAHELETTYENLVEQGREYILNGTNMCFGTDDVYDIMNYQQEKFLMNLCIVTGLEYSYNEDKDYSFYRCAC